MPTKLRADGDGIDVTELTHLADPDWEDATDTRCIAAALVETVYVLQTNKSRAKQWCALLHFEVKEEEIMIDKEDKSIFGAVFRWVGRRKTVRAPSEVVAFRGTILQRKTLLEDLRNDWKVASARLESICRVDIGLKYLQKSIETHGPHNIWIVGHSLGAAIALAAAREFKRQERENLKAQLFNPPFIFPRLPELIFFGEIRKLLSTVRNGSTSISLPPVQAIYEGIQDACEVVALKMGLQDEEKLKKLYNEFIGFGNWVPNLYVNKMDFICSSYIKYLEILKEIYEKSHLVYETMKHLFCFEVAKKKTPWHMVPSAKLIVGFTDNNHHSICQWWSKNLQVQNHEYVLPNEIIQ